MCNRESMSGTQNEVGIGDRPSPPAARVLLSVYLWSGESAPGLPPPPLAATMIEDLLSASRCELQMGIASSVVSVFPDITQAVNAARRITRLMRSFCGASEEGALDGCLTLSRATEPIPSLDLLLLQQTRTLEPIRPGQVLLVGAICEEARTVPGLRFVELSGGVVKTRTVDTPDIVLQLLPPIGMEEADARPVVFKPTRPKRLVESSPVVIVPVAIPFGRVAAELGRPAQFEVAKALRPGSPAWLTRLSAIKVFLRQKFPDRLLNVSGKLAITAFAAFCVLAATAIYLGYSRSHQVLPEPPRLAETPILQPTRQVPSERAPASHELATTRTVDKAALRSGHKEKIVFPSPSTRVLGGDAGRVRAPSKDEVATVEAQDERPLLRGGLSFSTAEINNLIERADKEVGDGKFDAAINHYTIVLKHDPSNARAKQGIARARRNKGSD